MAPAPVFLATLAVMVLGCTRRVDGGLFSRSPDRISIRARPQPRLPTPVATTTESQIHSSNESMTVAGAGLTVGDCTIADNHTYNRYLRTRADFYPYNPSYGIQVFEVTEDHPQAINNSMVPHHTYVEERKRIPENVGTSPNHEANASDSVCPWKYFLDYDKDRIPMYIAHVECCRKGCLDPILKTESGDPIEHRDATCKPVTYNMPVLRREPANGCESGLFTYRVDQVNVSVSCACMRN